MIIQLLVLGEEKQQRNILFSNGGESLGHKETPQCNKTPARWCKAGVKGVKLLLCTASGFSYTL